MEKHEIERIISLYSDSVLKTAFSYVKNTCDAQDIAQDVFVSLIYRKKPYMSEEHIKAWLLRVTINKSKNFLKSSWHTKRSKMPEFLPCLDEEENFLLSEIMKLDAKYRIPLHLFYYEGYSIKEIAEILKKKPSTVGSYLDRGRKKLKDILGGDACE